jgi:LCP family protein required for cell wall assembly
MSAPRGPDRDRGRRRRRSHPLRRFALGSLVIVLCTTIAISVGALGVVSTIAADFALAGKPLDSRYLTPAKPGAAETILVIGDDHIGPTTTYANGAEQTVDGAHLLHADTFMLVRMDPSQEQTSIISIPRDLLVNFTWHGQPYSGKFNSTYSLGGVDLVKKVALSLMPGLTINHVIDFNFNAFTGLIDAIGCVYIDVDHRYYNAPGGSYQPINVQAGYQRLCGEPALAYVRYRHTDSDFVRVARQQDFIRQAKEQLGVWGFLSKWQSLAKAFGKAVGTDIRGDHTILNLLNLVAFSQSKAVREVHFLVNNTDYVVQTSQGLADTVTSTPQLIKQSLDNFLYIHPPAPTVEQAAASSGAGATASAHHHHHVTKVVLHGLAAEDLYPLSSGVTTQALELSAHVPFQVYLPSVQTGPAVPNDFHPYRVGDLQHHWRYGYRVDWQVGAGLYYGFEGVNWTNLPLFANPSATETIGGRTYLFVNDGANIQYVGWRQGHDLYWVSNDLLDTLSPRQMLDLAESAQPVR